MRTPYARPSVNVPPIYIHADENAKAEINGWWQNFNDPQLNALVLEALKNNNDLALAALNVHGAALQTHLSVVNPTVAAGYTYDYSKQLGDSAVATQFHSFTAAVGYEIDLWGQLGALKDVVKWEARATEQDRQGVALALVWTAVNLYYEIAGNNQRITLGEQSIANAQKTLDLVHILSAAGAATKLEIAQAEQNLYALKAAQSALIEQRLETRNALNVLLNGNAWPEDRERSAVPDDPPPPVAAGLPAALLGRRPDLRAAELRLRETLAQTDATRLSFYPNLSLTGSLGTASPGLSELISHPLESLGVALALPFVQMDQASFASELARVQYEKAVVSFRKALLQALIDVDNALAARSQLTQEGAELERSLKAAQTAENLNEVRYRAGSAAQQSWLAAQEVRRQAEGSLEENRLTRLQNYATLCLALGGEP